MIKLVIQASDVLVTTDDASVITLQTPEVRTGVKLQEVLSNGENGVRYVKFLEEDQAGRPSFQALEVRDATVFSNYNS